MTEPINSKPIHMGFIQDLSGDVKLTLSCQGVNKEVSCKVVEEGVLGSIRSVFLQRLDGWISIQSPDFKNKHIQVFIKQSDLKMLQDEGFNIALQGACREDRKEEERSSISSSMRSKIEECFKSDKEKWKDDDFLDCIDGFIKSGGKKLILNGRLFNDKGQCPDIFDDPMFDALEELSLQEIRELPPSLTHLKTLKHLDLSHSSIAVLPKSFKNLTNLEYLNLGFSRIDRNLVAQVGKEAFYEEFGEYKEFSGRDKENELYFYETRGESVLTDDLSKKLPGKLKAINLASSPFGKELRLDKDVIINYDKSFSWKEIDLEVATEPQKISKRLTATVEAFFGPEEEEAEYFLARIEDFIESGGKKLVLDGMVNGKGECPDIFRDPLFSSLEELSLKGIKKVPDSIGYLKNLKDLDLSKSAVLGLPSSFVNLKNLEYLNLAFSALNQKKALVEVGRVAFEQERGGESDEFYQQKAIQLLTNDLILKLAPLKKLKGVNMASADFMVGPLGALAMSFRLEGRENVVKNEDGENWRLK